MVDLSPLIKGLFPLIAIAISLGQYPKLEHWARAQAAEAIAWKTGLPYFFPHQGRSTMKFSRGHAFPRDASAWK